MTIHFHIEYRTVFGEELVLNIVKKKNKVAPYRMTTHDGITWHCTLNGLRGDVIDYFFSVEYNGVEKRREWQTVAHRLELKPAAARRFHVYNRWIDMPEDSYLYSSAFTECLKDSGVQEFRSSGVQEFRSSGVQKTVNSQLSTLNSQSLRLIVRAPQLRENQRLAICGESKELGCWNAEKSLPMTQHNYNEWVIDLNARDFVGKSVELKFLAIQNQSEKEASPSWGRLEGAFETRENRTLTIPADLQGGTVVYELDQAFFPFSNQRFAGTLVPVFSLRSKGSFGVGDFGDLRLMIDWVARTGQRLLQVLPINDTTSTHTWTDSYPYSCISVFALHPQYADLRQLPALKDAKLRKRFEALRKELNALPQMDYERVNKAKIEYLEAIFEQEGKKMMKSNEFKQFFSESEQWLVPYAKYCLLRDKTKNAEFYYFVQFILNQQMKAVHDYARQHGIILKGDIPIGVSRTGCDVWMEPRYFNMDGQAGAPPDDFSADGQNWGFPTYNWDEMLKDGCAWWVRRFQNMSQFFDAYRIDHVLGFFRIWEIPMPHSSGLEGQFSPALGLTIEEIHARGVYNEIDNLFLPGHKDSEKLHPRINAQKIEAFGRLSGDERDAFNRLYDDYFYRRNNQFWYGEAMKKLSRLVEATRMLVCAEDLGMVPECVQWVMDELRILSLELQSMPKEPGLRFGQLERNPYRSVCTISTHDTPTLRMWWDEDWERAQTYYNQMLRKDGPAPHPLPDWLARDIIAAHLASPSMVCVIALQDWLAIDEHLRLKDAEAERVNVPANPKHYWRYRMHLNIEDLIGCEGFTNAITQLVTLNGR